MLMPIGKATGNSHHNDNHLPIQPPQAGRRALHKENALKHITQDDVPTQIADFDTTKKDRVWQSKGHQKDGKARKAAKVKEARHLDNTPRMSEAPHLQATPEHLFVENG